MEIELRSFAPVLIPTLCRFEHFKRCVTTLAACTHASETILYIALDYPLNDNHWDGYRRIVSYLEKGISGFKEVRIIRRSENFGAEKNLEDAKQQVYKQFDTYILSEDDNEFSPNFLDYMNKCLLQFKNAPSIYSICGYCFPGDNGFQSCNIYLDNRYSAWGAGMWKEKEFPWDFETVKGILNTPRLVLRLYRKRPIYILFLLRMIKNHTILGDYLVSAYSIAHGRHNVFPVISKVRNCGHDGTGIHCNNNDALLFHNQIIDQNILFQFDVKEITQNKFIRPEENLSLGQRLKIIPKLMLYWLNID